MPLRILLTLTLCLTLKYLLLATKRLQLTKFLWLMRIVQQKPLPLLHWLLVLSMLIMIRYWLSNW